MHAYTHAYTQLVELINELSLNLKGHGDLI